MRRLRPIPPLALLLLLLLSLAASPIPIPSSVTLPAFTPRPLPESPLTQPALTAPANTTTAPAPASQPIIDSSPGPLLLVLLAIIVFIFCVVLAILFFILALLAFLVLLFFGVFSLTMLVGILRRSVSAAAKALTIQLLALAGIPVGIALLALLAHFLHWPINPVVTAFLGILCGAASGAAIGYFLTLALSLLFTLVARKLTPATPVSPTAPASPSQSPPIDVTPLNPPSSAPPDSP